MPGDELTSNTRAPSSSRPVSIFNSLAIVPRYQKVRMKRAFCRRVIRPSMDSTVLKSANEYTYGRRWVKTYSIRFSICLVAVLSSNGDMPLLSWQYTAVESLAARSASKLHWSWTSRVS